MAIQKKKKFSTALLVLLILALGGASAFLFIKTKPKTKRVRPPASSPLVTTVTAKRSEAALIVEALGTVKADQETVVRVRVSGQVEELGPQFNVGGLMQQGDLLLRLDDDDYVNALALKESALDKAKADYSLEMGQQRVARTEIAQLSRTAPAAVRNTALALRQPQLAQAKASLQAAEVDVKQAKLNLDRTKIMVPYNALVTARNVSMGSQASISDTVATLVGTDNYHIEAAIPLDKLQGLGMDVFNDTPVKIITATGAVRQGKVRHSIATLDATTRMGRVLIEVADPLALKSDEASLLLGDQVRVELQAGTLANVVELPRSTLRGNNALWVVKKNADGSTALDIRPIQALWKDSDSLFVGEGLVDGDLVVNSPLGAPIQGMSVRVAGASATQSGAVPKGKGQGQQGSPRPAPAKEVPTEKRGEQEATNERKRPPTGDTADMAHASDKEAAQAADKPKNDPAAAPSVKRDGQAEKAQNNGGAQ